MDPHSSLSSTVASPRCDAILQSESMSKEAHRTKFQPGHVHQSEGLQAPSKAMNRPTSPSLASLPPELHILVFDLLSPVSATCLGLTCKTFYSTYKTRQEYQQPVSLGKRIRIAKGCKARLCWFLCDWAGNERHLVTFVKCSWMNGKTTQETKFVTEERFQVLRKEGRLYHPWVIPGCKRLGWTTKGENALK